VNVTVLMRGGGGVQHEHPEGSTVLVDVDLEHAHEGVMTHGTVTAPWEGECRRCARTARGTVVAEVRELFAKDSDPETTYPLRGEQLDLEPLARDAVLLELPAAPLCAEECQGLCPTCGIDLNAQAGPHEHQVDDPRWAALDALRTDPEPSRKSR
jgi:uncharacterized protein